MTSSSWSALEPWDKLSRWIEASPDMAPEILAMAKDVSRQRLKHEQAALQQRMEEEAREAEHRRQLELRESVRNEIMDARLWYAQCGSLGLSALSLVLLAIITVKFGADAVVPALALTGANGGVAAASALVSHNVRKSWQRSRAGFGSAQKPGAVSEADVRRAEFLTPKA